MAPANHAAPLLVTWATPSLATRRRARRIGLPLPRELASGHGRLATPFTGIGHEESEGITSQFRGTLFRPSDCPNNRDHLTHHYGSFPESSSFPASAAPSSRFTSSLKPVRITSFQ